MPCDLWTIPSMVTMIALGDRNPNLFTHREIDAVLERLGRNVDCSWVSTDSPEASRLEAVDGVWLLPGSPYRNDEAAYEAITHCLTSGTPFLGTCAGFQYACVALVRSLAGVGVAGHAEAEPGGTDLVIAPLTCSLYGERRTVTPVAGTLLATICGVEPFEGYHYCGYGLAPGFVQILERVGVVMSAFGDDVGVEAIELTDHPFFVGTAFQPQVGTGSGEPVHPLIEAFLKACAVRSGVEP